MVSRDDVSVLILAGGQALRMGGVDKGRQLYHGVPLIEHVISAAQPFTNRIVISANQNIEYYKTLADDVVVDQPPWQTIGPLGGLFAMLPSLEDQQSILILPCDTPRISTLALESLLAASKAAPSKVHCLKTENGWQPLHAVLPVARLKQCLSEYLDRAEHFGVMGFYNFLGYESVYWDRQEELLNINRIEELNL